MDVLPQRQYDVPAAPLPRTFWPNGIPLPGSSPAEELASAATHGLGAVLAVAGLIVLVVASASNGDPWQIVGLSIYGLTLVLLYVASTLYHLVSSPRTKGWLRLLDHASIFLLIAGTYTPVTLVTLRGAWGWTLFGLVWAMAVGGIISKLFLIHRFAVLSVVFYLGMGWLVLVAIEPLLRLAPPGFVTWLLAGGAAYTLGIVAYSLRRVRFHHAVWHLFVLAGSACHFVGLLVYIALA